MRILVIGATGTIGSALVHELAMGHNVIQASRTRAPLKVDIGDPDSISKLFTSLSQLDAVVCVAGPAVYAPLFDLTDSDFQSSLARKLMGQVNLLRLGMGVMLNNGSFTFTGGMASRYPMEEGGVAISMVNAGLEGFVRAAAQELPRGIRLNIVAPGWVSETRERMGLDRSVGWPAVRVARRYVEAIEGSMSGQVLDAG